MRVASARKPSLLQTQHHCLHEGWNQDRGSGIKEEENDRMAYVIAEPCVGVKDAACVDACPVDCIHPKKDETEFGDAEMLYIDPVECIDCGACVPVCPVAAIFALEDLPEKWASFTQRNADYYEKR